MFQITSPTLSGSQNGIGGGKSDGVVLRCKERSDFGVSPVASGPDRSIRNSVRSDMTLHGVCSGLQSRARWV
jgi:hypothetical protein